MCILFCRRKASASQTAVNCSRACIPSLQEVQHFLPSPRFPSDHLAISSARAAGATAALLLPSLLLPLLLLLGLLLLLLLLFRSLLLLGVLLLGLLFLLLLLLLPLPGAAALVSPDK